MHKATRLFTSTQGRIGENIEEEQLSALHEIVDVCASLLVMPVAPHSLLEPHAVDLLAPHLVNERHRSILTRLALSSASLVCFALMIIQLGAHVSSFAVFNSSLLKLLQKHGQEFKQVGVRSSPYHEQR